MPHPADFVDAHRCHWADAELLFGHALWANADLLYGFSAECGLKAVMTTLGMPVGGLAAGASLIEAGSDAGVPSVPRLPAAFRWSSHDRQRRAWVSTAISAGAVREALLALPEGANHGVPPSPFHVYLPPSHIKALNPGCSTRDRHAGRRQDLLVERAAGRGGAATGGPVRQVAAVEREHRGTHGLRPRAVAA